MNYEKDVERLQTLYEEVAIDQEYDDDEEEKETDVLGTTSGESDTEQELEEVEEVRRIDSIQDKSISIRRDGFTKWMKHCTSGNVRTRKQ